MQDGHKNTDNIAGDCLKIIGFGNRFRCDDGFGPAVIDELKKLDLSRQGNIEIIDGGTSGSELINHLKECPRIIIVDAVDAGQHKAGIVCINEKDIKDYSQKGFSSLSLHDLGLSDILGIARALKMETDVTIIGVNPLKIGYGDSISPEVRACIPVVVSIIQDLI